MIADPSSKIKGNIGYIEGLKNINNEDTVIVGKYYNILRIIIFSGLDHLRCF